MQDDKKDINKSADERRLAEAMDWVVRLENPDAPGDARTAFEEWTTDDPANKAAFESALETWDLMAAAELIADGTIAPEPHSLAPVGALQMHRSWPAMALIAATLLILVSTVFFKPETVVIPPSDPQTTDLLVVKEEHTTPVGRTLKVSLADGSELALNTATKIKVSYTKNERRLDLEQGEIQVDVASDENRPLRVFAGSLVAEAVGTRFVVRKANGQTTVTLSEGIVQVLDSDAGQDNERFLHPGQMVVWDKVTGLGRVEDANIESETAWTRGLLIFEGARLDIVLAELNRYLTWQYELSDADLGALQVTAVFQIDSLDEAILVIRTQFQLQELAVSENRVMLSRSPPTRPR